MFHPGLMSVDSMYQFAQVLGLQPLDDIHPPLYVLLWRATHALLPGPAGLFLLTAALWWGSLASIVWSRLHGAGRWPVLFAIGAWPPALLMLGHLWKDVAMAAMLLLSVAAIVRWRRGGGAAACGLAIAALAAAAALRHNGLFAALPLLAWLLWPRRPGPGPAAFRRAGLLALLVACALAVLPAVLSRLSGAQPRQAWTVVLMWDLAPLSIAAGRVLYPPSLLNAELALEDLEQAYASWANPPLFATGKLRLSFYQHFDAARRKALLSAWWRAVREDPGTWLRHRSALFGHLLRGTGRALPRDLVYVPERRLPPGAGLALPPVEQDRAFIRLADALLDTPAFAGWPYLLAALLAPLSAMLRRRRAGASLALAASALANALPLWVIAGSAEFRYLLWTVLAAALAWLFALSAPARSPRRLP